jgi:hypothetical protein
VADTIGDRGSRHDLDPGVVEAKPRFFSPPASDLPSLSCALNSCHRSIKVTGVAATERPLVRFNACLHSDEDDNFSGNASRSARS